MKPYITAMVLQFLLKRARPCTILCFNVHTTVEYLKSNVSIGQSLQHISRSIVVCIKHVCQAL